MCVDGAGKRRYSVKLWKTFTDCFNVLPIAAIVEEKIFCCHGGLSPDLQTMDQIRAIERPADVPDTGLFAPSAFSSLSSSCDIHVQGLFVTCFGATRTRIPRNGARTTAACRSPSGQRLCSAFCIAMT